MKRSRMNSNHDDVEEYYVFPYRIIEGNNTLWVLRIHIGDNYKGGVEDLSFTIDADWGYDVELEEITREEFMDAAYATCKHVVERRIMKIQDFQRKMLT
jgi:hypothetical protein